MQVNQHLHTSSAVGNLQQEFRADDEYIKNELNQLKKDVETQNKIMIEFGEETMEKFEEIHEKLNVLLFERGLLEAGNVLGNLPPLFRAEDISRLFDDDTPTDELNQLKKLLKTQKKILNELRVKTMENFEEIEKKLNVLLS